MRQSQRRKTRELHIPSFCINPAYELSMLLSQRHWRLLARWAPAACAQEGEEGEGLRGEQSQRRAVSEGLQGQDSLRGSAAEGQQQRVSSRGSLWSTLNRLSIESASAYRQHWVDEREADSQCGKPSRSGCACVGLAVDLPTEGAAHAAGEEGDSNLKMYR